MSNATVKARMLAKQSGKTDAATQTNVDEVKDMAMQCEISPSLDDEVQHLRLLVSMLKDQQRRMLISHAAEVADAACNARQKMVNA